MAKWHLILESKRVLDGLGRFGYLAIAENVKAEKAWPVLLARISLN
jgi:hypothetical protein